MRLLKGRIVQRLVAALLLTLPAAIAPASAETRQALLIADRAQGQEAGQPGRDALAVSRALLAAGFDVRRLENPVSLPDAPVEPPDVMLIYLSADAAAADGQPGVALTSGTVALAALAARYPAAQQIVLAESCAATAEDGSTAADAVAEAGEATAAAASMIAHSPAAADCSGRTRLTSALLAALEQPGVELGRHLAGAGLPLARGDGWAGFTALAAAPGTAGGEMLILDQPLRPVDQLMPSARPGALSGAGQAAAAGVQIFNAAAPALPLTGDRQARPTQAGLPEPSIIVGERPREDGDTPEAEDITGAALGTSFEERRRIRASDPQAFASLLDSGAFDPPADQMASAIQTELQRMNCYTGRVDGDWGNGSRQAVDRYFQQAGGTPTTREADTALFRQIALKDDLRCPDVVVAPRAPSTASGTRQSATRNTTRNTATTTRSTARQPTATRQPQPARTAPAPAPTTPKINPNALGSGIFR